MGAGDMAQSRKHADRRMYARNKRDEVLINAVVRKALRDTFLLFDVDINKSDDVKEFRDDLRFGRQVRKLAWHGTLAVVSTAVVAAAISAWAGIVSAIRGHQ